MEITLSAVTYEDWRDIVKRAVKQARLGNSQARKFLADYLLGPPPQRHEISGLLKSLDLSALTDAQLERLAAGEDVIGVLSGSGKG